MEINKAQVIDTYIEKTQKKSFLGFLWINKILGIDDAIKSYLTWEDKLDVKSEKWITNFFKNSLIINFFLKGKKTELDQLKEYLELNKDNQVELTALKNDILSWQKIADIINDEADNHEVVDSWNEEYLQSAKELYNNLEWEKPSRNSFKLAYIGYQKLWDKIQNKKYLTIVDFSKSRDEERFYVIDVDTKQVEFKTKVGHAKNTWWEYASDFSNQSWSNKSSLGFMLTSEEKERNSKDTREWLRLYGVEKGINDQTDERGIFIHSASVTGSEGCFTIPDNYKPQKIMDKIIGKSLVFSYAPDANYLAQSSVLNTSNDKVSAA